MRGAVTLNPTGMSLQQAAQIMQRFGIGERDLPDIAQALQVLISHGYLSPRGGAGDLMSPGGGMPQNALAQFAQGGGPGRSDY